MIPKKIHYCWFGRGPKPKSFLKYLESWKKYLPDYEIKEWNEDNFDVYSTQYTAEAHNAKKYAFLTDYVRLYALYHEGGIYMDTDVEVCGSFDKFLHHKAFSGFETDGNVPTGMMAAEKGSRWAFELLKGYTYRRFLRNDGSFDLTTNTATITHYMVKQGLKLDNTYQDFPDLCTMYPADFFCPKDHRTGAINKTENTVCIHHFNGSWLDKSLGFKIRHGGKYLLVKLLGANTGSKIADFFTGRSLKK